MKTKISLPVLIGIMFAFSLLVAVLASQFLFKKTAPVNNASGSIAKQLPAGGFTLRSADGDVSLSDFKGKLVLLYFGYTSCPDICPTSLALMGQAMSHLSDEEKAQVQGLFVSVDPTRDTPDKLKEYSHYYGAKIIAVTGKQAKIEDITKRYGVTYEIQKKDKNGNYSVDHTSITLLIGKDGQIKELLPHGMPADQMIKKLREYL